MHTYRLRYYVHPGQKEEVTVTAPSRAGAVATLPPTHRIASMAVRCEARTKSAPHGQCATFFPVDPAGAEPGTRCPYHRDIGA